MKNIIYIILLLSFNLSAQNTYYVSTTGNDSNPGTFNEPWLTWEKGFTSTSVNPGDTVYFKGGVYYMTNSDGLGYTITRIGTEGNRVYYWAYPADWAEGNYPILDCSNVDPPTDTHRALFGNVSDCYFKGLHVRNVRQKVNSNFASGWIHYGSTRTIWENCVTYNIHGQAFTVWGNKDTYFINCDAYSNSDSLALNNPGNSGSGFHVTNTTDSTASVYYKGCRAWDCGDQGFTPYTAGIAVFDSCWSFRNGQQLGGGHGWKLGWQPLGSMATATQRVLRNCIVTWNRHTGLTTNDNNLKTSSMEIYNCFIYKNWDFSDDYPHAARGILIYNTSQSDEEELRRVFRNNISYENTVNAGDVNIRVDAGALYTHSNNSWDIGGLIVTDDDFVSLDYEELLRPRKADGSLPDIDFGRLKSTSYLINQGTDVGLPYNGSAPDLGAHEFTPTEPPAAPNVATGTITKLTPYTAQVKVNLTYDGGGTILQSGVCWSTSENPTTEDDKTEEGEQAGVFTTDVTGLVKATTYYFRAYATNSLGTSYGENVIYSTPEIVRIKDGTKFLKWNGKFIDW